MPHGREGFDGPEHDRGHRYTVGISRAKLDGSSGLLRALVMVEPDQAEGFRIAGEELSRSRSSLTATKCEIDPGDPDAQWQWLAEGIIASSAMFEDREPHFVMLGAERLDASTSAR